MRQWPDPSSDLVMSACQPRPSVSWPSGGDGIHVSEENDQAN